MLSTGEEARDPRLDPGCEVYAEEREMRKSSRYLLLLVIGECGGEDARVEAVDTGETGLESMSLLESEIFS